MTPPTDIVDSVRRRNLSAVLELVHRGEAPSRAELTASTGLNRSTVGALVGELVDLGLVDEVEPLASARAGRPSPRVVPASGFTTIAVNPEVDAITAAVVGLGARVERRVRREVEHPPSPTEAVRVIARLIDELRSTDDATPAPHAIGIAIPGIVRRALGDVRWAPHLEWREVPFARLVRDATGLPTFADNDATAAAHAEWLFGAGRGASELVYLNGGASGIGGGVIVHGRPLGGAHGYAGEFGQNRPGVGDARDRVTEGGTLEDEVSRSRLLAAVGLASADEPSLRAALFSASDRVVVAEMDRQQRILAVAIANAVNVFNPQLVVLGGFLSTLLEHRPGALEAAVEAGSVPAAWEGVRIAPAALGEDRVLIGAAELAFAPTLADPAGVNAR